MSDLYADIIIDISVESLDRTFQYKVPRELEGVISIGDIVKVMFGRGNRKPINGFVIGLSNEPKIEPEKIKEILECVTDHSLVEQKLLELAYWIKTRYGSTMNQALKTVLPVKKNIKKVEQKKVLLNISEEEALEKIEFFKKKHQVARLRLLEELIKEKELDTKIVTDKLNVSSATIKALTELGIVKVESERVYRNTVGNVKEISKKTLLEPQQEIVDDFIKDYRENVRRTYLLRGITGSGKTEVYMEMIQEVVDSGKSVIVLIPEIALTYQTVMRFLHRFGDRVSTLHSRLSDGEKYDQFERAKKHEIDIMIGPRSALFTPFDNLGLIVIDEEHEQSYKSDQMPKYHARDVAIKLASLHNASVVLGSATPDVISYNKAKNGEYKLYSLTKRANNAPLPKAELVDLRQELKNGNKSIFSNALQSKIADRLSKGEQVMLFLNRRGYAGFVSCRSCGEALKCPHCDVSLTAHYNGKMVCHYCGYEIRSVKECPNCKSSMIGGMRAGTQAVEEQIKKLFPYANVLRMDKDTTSKKQDYERILSSFANREADILVGTQMIVKGHDFPYVTLVGVLAADLSLNANDYKAAERTYQLIVQAAGRAGRGSRSGEVIVQTYQTEHYAIASAIKQDYEEFYNEETNLRRIMHYPPMGHIMAVLIESNDNGLAGNISALLAGKLRDGIIPNIICIGPAEASIKKINDIYRYVIYVKSLQIDELVKVKDYIENITKLKDYKNLRISFDLDPMNGY